MTVKLREGIIQELPQIPYIIDQVSEAFDWAKEELSEGEYNSMLNVVYDVTEYAKHISEPNFFKTHLIVATILSYIPNVKKSEKFAKFETASKAIEKSLDGILIDPEDIRTKGCFKSTLLKITPLAKGNIELFTLMLIEIKHILLEILEGMKEAKVKSPVTSRDYVTILGYALVMANLRMANLKLPNATYEIYNEISIILNNEFNY